MWYGVDYDKTLVDENGRPIESMLQKVIDAVNAGLDVRIFTARASTNDTAEVEQFLKDYVGKQLPITNIKDPEMQELWDDKALNPEQNMLQGIGQLAGVQKEVMPKKKKKKGLQDSIKKFMFKSSMKHKFSPERE